MKPFASRSPCQQSSMFTYMYPASFMPLVTMASAVSRIICSLTLHANLFQLFQPICGVLARPSNFCACATPVPSAISSARAMTVFILNSPESREFRSAGILPAEGLAQRRHGLIPRLIFAFQRLDRGLGNAHAEFAIGLELLFVEELVGGSLVGEVGIAAPVRDGVGVHTGDRRGLQVQQDAL